MPACATPPSLALKNLIWVALGLPSVIVQATIEPLRGAVSGLLVTPTLAWKPVVRLTARQGVAGQLATVAGLVVGGSTPTSASVAEEPVGSRSTSTTLVMIALEVRFISSLNTTARRM